MFGSGINGFSGCMPQQDPRSRIAGHGVIDLVKQSRIGYRDVHDDDIRVEPRELGDGFIPTHRFIRHDNVLMPIKDTPHADPFKFQRIDDEHFDPFQAVGTTVVCRDIVKTCSHKTPFHLP